MWKRIRSRGGEFSKRFVGIQAAGAALWGAFVGVTQPPGTSILKLAVVISASYIGICLIAMGMCKHFLKTRSEEDREDRPALLTVTKPTSEANRAELPK